MVIYGRLFIGYNNAMPQKTTAQTSEEIPKKITEKNIPANSTKNFSGEIFEPRFDAAGLLCAVVLEASTGELLMCAFMNREALDKTIATGEAHFFSRSRNRLWKKGEESGNVLSVREVRVDCDQDCLALFVDVQGAGAACHTGAKSCFYRVLKNGTLRTLQ